MQMLLRGIAIALLGLLVLGSTAQADPLYFALSEHTMTSEVDECGVPADSRVTFDTTDVQAISWLKIWRDHRPHPVEWRWYSPNMRVYHRTFGIIPAIDGPVGYWGSNIWSGLPIDGYEVAMMPGTWKVDVIVDFRKVLTEYFNIGGHQSPGC
ncbi:MAG: hypothetical protein A4E45_00881 [Methanosaeta sp. PtaB.Bin039]|nr:MAG: hypothetical protein A4E45_00881 [Methanosaeta sp. PtaB.Bin039]OPY45269.1 MAG: hypothetical protein A4E47_01047 [Methanosaeta sp. PtaU1.Bin028]